MQLTAMFLIIAYLHVCSIATCVTDLCTDKAIYLPVSCSVPLIYLYGMELLFYL